MNNKSVINHDILLRSEAYADGMTKKEFNQYVKDNNFERVGYGVYANPDTILDDLFIIHHRCPHAVFSHDEALYYHGLAEREPIQHTLTVYTGYNTKRLTESGFKVYTVKKELIDLGKITVTDFFGNTVPMYDMERTICDLVRNRKNYEIQDFQAALKFYVKKTDKNLNQLMKYAKEFHVDRIIRNYMEVLL